MGDEAARLRVSSRALHIDPLFEEFRVTQLTRLWTHAARQIAVVASLAFASVLCGAMLAVRTVYADSLAYIGLAWNLLLAWLPMVAALTAYNLKKRDARGVWLLIAPCAFLWLLFFPNAPYILTDILHLGPRNGVPLWYDLIMLVAFAWTGTFLGLVSLYLMHTLVRRTAGGFTGWLFTFAVLAVTGFGVYLGRFPRWNSWDLFISPLELLGDIWQRARHPLAHPRTIVFSGLFSLCVTAMYLMLAAIIHFSREGAERQPADAE
jgi:uncharacterized membrane protein